MILNNLKCRFHRWMKKYSTLFGVSEVVDVTGALVQSKISIDQAQRKVQLTLYNTKNKMMLQGSRVEVEWRQSVTPGYCNNRPVLDRLDNLESTMADLMGILSYPISPS